MLDRSQTMYSGHPFTRQAAAQEDLVLAWVLLSISLISG